MSLFHHHHHHPHNKAPMEDSQPYQLLGHPMFHMCKKHDWETATHNKQAYIPATFHKDGNKTHASMHPSGLLGTANHFCRPVSPGHEEWICIELDPMFLWNILGIVTLVEPPAAVGDKAPPASEKKLMFPHIYGGIPTTIPGVVTRIFPMVRSKDGTFVGIPGLLDE